MFFKHLIRQMRFAAINLTRYEANLNKNYYHFFVNSLFLSVDIVIINQTINQLISWMALTHIDKINTKHHKLNTGTRHCDLNYQI